MSKQRTTNRAARQHNKSKVEPIDPAGLIENFCKFYEEEGEQDKVAPEDAIGFLVRELFWCGHKKEMTILIDELMGWMGAWYGREALREAIRRGVRNAAERAYGMDMI